MTKVLGLVAVRSDSTRLPGKAFRDLNGRPILKVLTDRLKESSFFADVIICTTQLEADDCIETFCKTEGLKCFRGENENVLKRFVGAAETCHSDYVVRITGDNPLTDFEVLKYCLEVMQKNNIDYGRPGGVPVGTAAEIIRTEKLFELEAKSAAAHLSEYMTYFFELAPFIQDEVIPIDENLTMPDLRLTIDFEEDLQFMNQVLKHFAGTIPSLEQSVAYCRSLKQYPRFIPDNEKADDIKAQITFLEV